MLVPLFLLVATLISAALSASGRVTSPNSVPRNAVLLSQVNSITLRSGQQTASRRVSPVPQLQCVGPADVCSLYAVDVMRCTNEGGSYDVEDIEWSCSAHLPDEFKLGSTDVSCEGYASSDDPYILKGSCGVEYRLILTDKGEEKYGRLLRSKHEPPSVAGELIVLIVICCILAAIFLAARRRRDDNDRRGGGGGGGGGSGPYDGPPPPYDSYPGDWSPPKKEKSYSSSSRTTSSGNASNQQGWRPGFWTGAATGAAAGGAAGYAFGSRNQQQAPYETRQPRNSGIFSTGRGATASVNVHAVRPESNIPSPTPSSSTHESTGFGSTSRR